MAIVTARKGGAAADAGLRAGDVITKVGSDAISTVQSLTEALAGYSSGDKVSVTYQRGGATKTAQVTLASLT